MKSKKNETIELVLNPGRLWLRVHDSLTPKSIFKLWYHQTGTLRTKQITGSVTHAMHQVSPITIIISKDFRANMPSETSVTSWKQTFDWYLPIEDQGFWDNLVEI
uniref:Uncharacterized protein n=1 Tax=Megaselia scalaris TaxID=36166 RepID=T1GS40_MEGSC